MKNFLLTRIWVTVFGFLLIFFFSISTTAQNLIVPGEVTYGKPDGRPLPGMMVKLLDENYNLKAVTMTDSFGTFFFNLTLFENGKYFLKGSYDLVDWEAIDALDLLSIQLHLNGIDTLDPMAVMKADINQNGYLDPDDALMILKFYLGIIQSFPNGNWLYDTLSMSISNTDTGKTAKPARPTLHPIIKGDLLEPITDPNIKPTEFINKQHLIYEIEENTTAISVPIKVSSELISSAFELEFNVPAGCTYSCFNSVLDNIFVKQCGSKITLIWISPNGQEQRFSKGDILATIHFSVEDMDRLGNSFIIEPNNNSAFLNNSLERTKAELEIPQFRKKEYLSIVKYYPNPVVNNDLTVEFSLERRSNLVVKIYDLQGRMILYRNEGEFSAGIQKTCIDVSELKQGVYSLRLEAVVEKNLFVKKIQFLK